MMKCFALSLSDQYWLNPAEQPLEWRKVNFYHNDFSEDVGNILFGQIPERDSIDLVSPCNTSDGWLKKKWKILNGQRVLVKGGSGMAQQERSMRQQHPCSAASWESHMWSIACCLRVASLIPSALI